MRLVTQLQYLPVYPRCLGFLTHLSTIKYMDGFASEE